MKALYLTKRIK